MKPKRVVTSGVEGILIGILMTEFLTLIIVLYQKLCRQKNFIAEIIDTENNDMIAHTLRIVYICYLM